MQLNVKRNTSLHRVFPLNESFFFFTPLLKKRVNEFLHKLGICTYRLSNWLVFNLRHYIRDLSITGFVTNLYKLIEFIYRTQDQFN